VFLCKVLYSSREISLTVDNTKHIITWSEKLHFLVSEWRNESLNKEGFNVYSNQYFRLQSNSCGCYTGQTVTREALDFGSISNWLVSEVGVKNAFSSPNFGN